MTEGENGRSQFWVKVLLILSIFVFSFFRTT